MTEDNKKSTKTSTKKMGKGFAIASMVCGIVALAFCWSIWLTIACAIIALVLGIISLMKKAEGKGMAIAGVVTSSVALVISIIIVIVIAAFANKVVDTVNNWEVDDTTQEALDYLESWSDEVDACMEAKGVDPNKTYEQMTEAEQEIYFDCM